MTQLRVAHLHLLLDLDADPIAGLVQRFGERPTSFSGWIELTRTIEIALAEGRASHEVHADAAVQRSIDPTTEGNGT
jgi:hypothetical protein